MRFRNNFLIAVGVCIMMLGLAEFVTAIYVESWKGVVFSLLITALGTNLVVTSS